MSTLVVGDELLDVGGDELVHGADLGKGDHNRVLLLLRELTVLRHLERKKVRCGKH